MSTAAKPLFEAGKLIDLNELSFKLTGKYSASPFSPKGPGLSYVPPCNLDMTHNAPTRLFTGLERDKASQLPDNFSWADDDDVRKYKGDDLVGIILKPGNQLGCGSCWAWAST